MLIEDRFVTFGAQITRGLRIEEVKIASKDNVGSQMNERPRALSLYQIAHQRFERKSALCEWPLVDCCQDSPRFQEGCEFWE